MKYPSIEDYLFTLRFSGGVLSLEELIKYTNSVKTVREEAYQYALKVLVHLQAEGFVQIEIIEEDVLTVMILLTEEGEHLADKTAASQADKMLDDWIGKESSPKIA